jgi:DNA repair protein RadC
MFVRELRVTYEPRPDLAAIDDQRILNVPRETAAFLVPILENEPVEVFVVVLLTTKHRVLAYHEVARGAIDSVHVSPRDIFKAVLLGNAAALAVGHNHPSGDPTPSPEDCAITRTLSAGATLLGVQFLDHVIVGNGRYYSFKEGGGF